MVNLTRLPFIFVIGGLFLISACILVDRMIIVSFSNLDFYKHLSIKPYIRQFKEKVHSTEEDIRLTHLNDSVVNDDAKEHHVDKANDQKENLQLTHFNESVVNDVAKEHHVRVEKENKQDAIKVVTNISSASNDNANITVQGESAKDSKLHSNKPRYLLPLVYYCPMGPNSIYQGIRMAINYALHENRSIVQVPFNAHGSAPMADGMSRIKLFNETFDVDKLSKLVPVSTISDFIRDCGRNVPLASLVNLRVGKQSLTQDWTHIKLQVYKDVDMLEDVLGVTLPAIPDPGLSAAKIRNNFENSFETQCIAVLLRDAGLVYRTVDKYHEESYPLIDKYLTRSMYIRKMADQVSRVICDGKPFVSLHWRAMVESCHRMTDPPSKTCASYLLLNKKRNEIVNLTYNFVKSQHIQCMYISAPASQKVIYFSYLQKVVKGEGGVN
ncbi:uncharacterized protein LOC144356518 [Saccoglossus kowalevskii]